MTDWFDEAFQDHYPLIYSHRNFESAYIDVSQLVESLGIKSQSQILDLCCGAGRHLKAMNELEINCIGIDRSSYLISEAKKITDKVCRGDIRNLPFSSLSFDAVFSFFNSFGYFENDQEHKRVLIECSRVLKVGGYLVFDLMNSSYIIKNLIPYSERKIDGGMLTESRRVKNDRIEKEVKLTIHGLVKSYVESVKLFKQDDLKLLLLEAGFNILGIWGGFIKEPLTNDSQRLVVVGQKQ